MDAILTLSTVQDEERSTIIEDIRWWVMASHKNIDQCRCSDLVFVGIALPLQNYLHLVTKSMWLK